MKKIKNVTMTFYEFVTEHLELMNDKQIFAKLKNGDWELLYYTGDNIFQSTDPETVWYADDIEYWSFLPNLEN
jgi:hypothetical protein